MTGDDKRDLNDNELERLFSSARAEQSRTAYEIEPGGELLAAILTDAESQQAATAVTAPAAVVAGGNLWSDLRGAFGGWIGVGGLVACSVAGLLVGFSMPDALGTVTAAFTGGNEDVIDLAFEVAMGLGEG